MTEEQKDCEYCHFNTRGSDFSDSDGCRFQIAKTLSGYYINAWSGMGGERFDVESVYIHYCPMCGRKLGKEAYMPKTQMYVLCDNAYLGKSLHRIVRVTKQQLVTEPTDGGVLRFYRPRLESLRDGMPLVRFPKSTRSKAVDYTLKLVKEE